LHLSMHAVRLLAAILLLLSFAPSAHAHGEGLLIGFVIFLLPAHVALFLCLYFVTGLKGRYGKALVLYATAVIVLWLIQIQNWYHPLSSAIYAAIPVPWIDVFFSLAAALVVIYFALRSKAVPIAFQRPDPLVICLLAFCALAATLVLWNINY
jgi:hypothetical protein